MKGWRSSGFWWCSLRGSLLLLCVFGTSEVEAQAQQYAWVATFGYYGGCAPSGQNPGATFYSLAQFEATVQPLILMCYTDPSVGQVVDSISWAGGCFGQSNNFVPDPPTASSQGGYWCASVHDHNNYGGPFGATVQLLLNSTACGGSGQASCPLPTPDRNFGNPECLSTGGCGLGNPINTSTGNKFQHEIDYAGTDPYPLKFHRYYNSAGPGDGTIGARWTHSFSRSLVLQTSTEVKLLRDDGLALYFTQCGTAWCVAPDEVGTLTQRVTSGQTTGWTYVDETDILESYSAAGQLLSETARGGVTHTLGYDQSGRLTTITDSFGRMLTVTYDSSSRIQQVKDPSGGTIAYSYDTSQNLSTVTYQDQSVRTYFYNETGLVGSGAAPNLLTGIQDEATQRYATFAYDSQSRAVQSQHAGGADSVQVTYNSGGTASILDAAGANNTFTFSSVLSRNHLSSLTGGACAECGLNQSYTYDANGNVASKTDFRNNATTYTYDLTRNLEKSRTEASGTSVARTITTQWNANYRLPSLITEATRTTGFTYDSAGNALTKTITDTTVTPNASRTWTYTYDSYGRMLTAKGPRTDVNSTTTYTYYTCTTGYQCGQVQTVTDAVGNVTTYNTYNAHGEPLTTTDPNGVVATLTYDTRLRLTSRQVGTETTTFSYYPTGLLKQVTLPDSSYVLYTFDDAHRLTQISDGAGNAIKYTLDAMGNRTAENRYDPSNTLHYTHSRVINTLNELYQDVNAAGTAAVTTTFGYDTNGNQTSIAAPLSRNTANAYDALNRLTQLTDPASGITKFGYDAEDDLLSVIDPRNLTTSYQYNGFGDLTQQVSPDTSTTSNTYDSGGNLATSTDARSAVATYSYDAANRVSAVAYSNGGVTDQTISFTYDAGTYGKGHLTGASDANHSMAWTYDALGRVTNKSQTVAGKTKSVGYAYTNGDLTTLTTPSGQSVVYGYNSNHQVTSISVNGTTLLSAVTYEPFGALNGWTWGNGTTVSRTYDTDQKVSQISSAGVKGYTYDNAFRITGITDTSLGQANWTFGYDLLDRITSAARVNVTRGWTYDANGNRLTETGTNASTYTISATNNQITSISGSLSRTYSYDAAGNVQGWTGVTGSYNNRGRLITMTNSSTGETSNFTYNALGLMIEDASGSFGTVLIWYDEAGHLLGEYNPDGTVNQETIWLGDIPVATLRANGSSVSTYYVHSDHLNAPRQVTRPTDGLQMWRWTFDPFFGGDNTNPQGAGIFPYRLRLPGQAVESPAALRPNGFRDYDPAVGRYVESDPIGLKGGINTYAYVDDNPLDGVDPTGRVKIHGNWCGPDWTGGFKAEFNQLTPNQRRNVAPPIDPVDAACEKHDKCYGRCRDNYPCSPSDRSRCFLDCDLTLYAVVYSQGFSGYVVGTAMARGGNRNPGPNAKDCPNCKQ